MFHVLTGAPPYGTRLTWELVRQITSREPVDLSPLKDRVPEYVAAVVSRCLQKKPQDRFASAGELRRTLEAVIDHMELAESDTVEMPAPRRGQTILLHVEYQEAVLTGSYREFEIGPWLGGGNFADVYQATEKLSGEAVALKILKREWLGDTKAVARFRREATVLSRLSHPNIVRVRNFGRYGATFFIEMDFLAGRTLEDVAEEAGPMAPDRALSCVVPVLEGLSAIHEAGIVHRDVKPSNISLVGETPVVFDVNVAHVENLTNITQSGVCIGTPQYMAPEQALGEPARAASDVYGAGVVLYELLTASLPYEAESTTGLLERIATKPPVRITERRSDLPDQLPPVIDMMLARDPSARPPAAEAARLLRQVAT